jgi:hypothetical protein
MRTVEEVEKQLRALRLHGMAQTLQARCLQAQQSGAMSGFGCPDAACPG